LIVRETCTEGVELGNSTTVSGVPIQVLMFDDAPRRFDHNKP